MKTKTTWNAGYLHFSSPGLPTFEVPLLTSRDAELIQGILQIVYLEGQRDGAAEAFERSKALIAKATGVA